MIKQISTLAVVSVLIAGCSSAPSPQDMLPGGDPLPQDREESTAILPPPMQPPPQKNEFEIVGDYAGKQIVLTANGQVVFSGNRPLEPGGIRWQLRHDISTYPADLVIDIEGCDEPVSLSVPEGKEGALLIFRGCEVELVA